MAKRIKYLLTLIGAITPHRAIDSLRNILNYIRLGKWMSDNRFTIPRRLRNRDQVFNAISSRISQSKVLYLEFGVWTGRSMRYWAGALKNPETKLHGFDSFEGIPEGFDHRCPKGAMNVQGNTPLINDNRVSFFKGWFNETLPNYKLPDHDILIINIDCDLYSSTKTVLQYLREHIRPGVFLYFDDLSRTDHEALAFEEFIKDTGKHFKLIATDLTLNTSFFQCVDPLTK